MNIRTYIITVGTKQVEDHFREMFGTGRHVIHNPQYELRINIEYFENGTRITETNFVAQYRAADIDCIPEQLFVENLIRQMRRPLSTGVWAEHPTIDRYAGWEQEIIINDPRGLLQWLRDHKVKQLEFLHTLIEKK